MRYSSYQIIKFYSVSKSFGPKTVLSDLSFSISRGERVALIGENGSGKTTLAKMAAGLELPDHGEVRFTDNCAIGYLPQYLDLEGKRNLTLGEWVLESQGNLAKISKRLRELENQMANTSDQQILQSATTEWDTLHAEFMANDGYTLLDRSEEYLAALGLGHVELDRPIATLSGGESRRAALATLLLQNPDLIILDEPTNHLDQDVLEWLEDFLRQYRGAVLLISHDRSFLNRVANGIFELSSTTHQLHYYEGNYDTYIETKKKELLDQADEYQKQKEEITSLKRFLKKKTFTPTKVADPKDGNKMAYDRRGERNANSKRKEIARAKMDLESLEKNKLENPIPKDYTGIIFHPKSLDSQYALRLEEVKVTVEDRKLIENLSVTLSPGERIILQGPNGCGKTTLLKLLANRQQPDFGSIEYASQIQIGYLSQEPEFDDPSMTILEYLQSKYSLAEHALRNQLHQIDLIRGEYVKQLIETLSLGQKRRLQLLDLMLSEANVLLLDEPTNHLAPDVIDQLEEVLLLFPGAVLAVTHDRRFAEKVGTRHYCMSKDIR